MKKLPMITQGKKLDARFFTLLGLVSLLIFVSYWGQNGAQPASVTLPVERVTLSAPTPGQTAAEASFTQPPAPQTTQAAQQPQPEPSAQSAFLAYREKIAKTRAEAIRMLDEVTDNPAADAQTMTDALAEKAALARAMEQEACVETLLAARGFSQTLCSVQEDSVDVVVRAASLSEAEAAMIVDVAARETGIDASRIRVIAEN